MGPRFNGVEDTPPASGRAPPSIASMGPRFNGVEDAAPAVPTLPTAVVLQWGHALMAWKTSLRTN